MKSQYFYFEAQTGIIYNELPGPSRYYRFTFFEHQREAVEAIRERTDVYLVGIGFSYSQEDLDWLNANEIDRLGGLIPHPGNPNRGEL